MSDAAAIEPKVFEELTDRFDEIISNVSRRTVTYRYGDGDDIMAGWLSAVAYVLEILRSSASRNQTPVLDQIACRVVEVAVRVGIAPSANTPLQVMEQLSAPARDWLAAELLQRRPVDKQSAFRAALDRRLEAAALEESARQLEQEASAIAAMPTRAAELRERAAVLRAS